MVVLVELGQVLRDGIVLTRAPVVSRISSTGVSSGSMAGGGLNRDLARVLIVGVCNIGPARGGHGLRIR